MKLKHLALVASIPFLFACSELPIEPTQPKEDVAESNQNIEEKVTAYYKVVQVLDDGSSLAKKCKNSTEDKCRERRDFYGHSFAYLPYEVDSMMYEGKVVAVKNPKVVDVFRYQSLGGPRSLPVVISDSVAVE